MVQWNHMKIGIRKPNIKRMVKARTTGKIKRSVKRTINPLYGKKGMGIINNPKKALYNKIYQKTTVDVLTPLKAASSGHKERQAVEVHDGRVGHSLTKHILLCFVFVGFFTIPYYSLSKKHYWHA